jgi:hypothetical protein
VSARCALRVQHLLHYMMIGADGFSYTRRDDTQEGFKIGGPV